MVEQDVIPIHGVWSQMAWDWEILKSFLENHNILVTWVPCPPEGKSEIYKVPQFFILNCKIYVYDMRGLIKIFSFSDLVQ